MKTKIMICNENIFVTLYINFCEREEGGERRDQERERERERENSLTPKYIIL